MTPPMPTDETPSAGAVAKANAIRLPFLARGGISDIDGLRDATARALDVFAREREAAVWEEMRPYIQHWRTCITQTCHPSDVGKPCNCGLDDLLRAHAAEARRTG